MARKRNLDSAHEKNEAVEKPVPLPTLTHLQFLVLDILARFPRGTSAQNLREAMLQVGHDQRGPKFYQLMGRLNEAGMVESWQQEFDVAGSDVSRTFYKLTAAGRIAWRITLEFYAVRLKAHQNVFDRGSKSG